MTDNDFCPADAVKAQEQFCEEHNVPLFAPAFGICPHCGKNIYASHKRFFPLRGEYYDMGITVAQAASHHITYCPMCNYAFDD